MELSVAFFKSAGRKIAILHAYSYLARNILYHEEKTFILAIIFAITAFCAVAQETSAPKRITIIDGKFFSNLPEVVAKMMTPDGIKFL